MINRLNGKIHNLINVQLILLLPIKENFLLLSGSSTTSGHSCGWRYCRDITRHSCSCRSSGCCRSSHIRCIATSRTARFPMSSPTEPGQGGEADRPQGQPFPNIHAQGLRPSLRCEHTTRQVPSKSKKHIEFTIYSLVKLTKHYVKYS